MRSLSGVAFLFLLPVFSGGSFAQNAPLSAGARHTAAIIGIGAEIEQLETMRAVAPGTGETVQRLLVREKITEGVVAASLDADMVIAEIEREQTEIRTAQDYLKSQGDKAANVATLAGAIAGGGIGVVGNAMQFSDRTQYAGDGISIASGVVSSILSVMAVQLQRGGKKQVAIAPNMLARVFDRTAVEEDVYPDDVWSYLNSPIEPGAAGTRIAGLIAQWNRQGLLGPPGSAQRLRTIDFVTTSFPEHRRLSMSGLSERATMLGDLRAQVALMERDLAELMHSLQRAAL